MDELKNSSNKNWYSKITENVYKFNTIDNLNSDNIFVNYSNALQLKKNKNYFQAFLINMRITIVKYNINIF